MTTALSMRGVRLAVRDGPMRAPRVVQLLCGVDLDVHVGEIVALVGDERAGKSSLLRCAAGIQRPDAGIVRWFGIGDGEHPFVAPPGVALVADHLGYYPFLTAREALDHFATMRDLPLAVRDEAVFGALRQVALEAHAHHPIASLSPGARRRLVLAQGLLARPRLLLVDEPRDGGSSASDLHVPAILRALADEGLAVLCAARTLAARCGAATRAVRLADGVVTPLEHDARASDAPDGARRVPRVAEVAARSADVVRVR